MYLTTTSMAALTLSAIAPMLLACPTASDAAQLAAEDMKLQAAKAISDAYSDTGVVGQVIIRPVRPHATAGVPNWKPYQTTIQVLDPSGRPLTTFQSDADGNFRVVLPPGTYVLRPQSSGPYPRASEQTVVVSPAGFTSVRIIYQSGIR
jgi:hypothetical protein